MTFHTLQTNDSSPEHRKMRILAMSCALVVASLLPSCVSPDLGNLYSISSSNSHFRVVQATNEDSVTIDVGPRGESLRVTVEVEATSGSFCWSLTHDGDEYWAGRHDPKDGEVVFEVPAKEGYWMLCWEVVDFSGDFAVRISSVGH